MNTLKSITSAILSLVLMSGCAASANAETAVKQMSVLTQTAEHSSQLQIEYEEEDLNETFDKTEAVTITLNETSASCTDERVTINGTAITIAAGGTYVLNGTLNSGNLIVASSDKNTVRIVLNGASLTSEAGPAIYVSDASKVILTAVTGTVNSLSAGGENSDEKKGGIYTKEDLVINGGGTLNIRTTNGDGIHGNDTVRVFNTILSIDSASDGMEVNDLIAVQDCILTVTAKGDGLQASGDTDETASGTAAANVLISGGVITIAAEDDCLQASGDVITENAEVNLTAGGGAEKAVSHTGSSGKTGGWGREGSGFMPGEDSFSEGGFPYGGKGRRRNENFGGLSGNETDQEAQGSTEAPDLSSGATPYGNETEGQSDLRGRFGTGRPEEGSAADGSPEQNGQLPAEDVPEMFRRNRGGRSEDAAGNTTQPEITASPSPSLSPSSDAAKDAEAKREESASSASESDSEKAKGISVDGNAVISSGTVKISSADDGINAAGNVTLKGGNVTISSGDDAVHADDTLTFEDGRLVIAASYEGLEATSIVIENGTIDLTADDDGINTSNKLSGKVYGMEQDDGSTFTMNGGTVTVNSGGDGIDLNGSGSMNGGLLTIYGPENNGNGALDYTGTFTVNGGTLMAGGSSGMAMTPSSGSGAKVLVIGVSDPDGAVEVKDSSGRVICTYESEKNYETLVIASDQLKEAETCTIMQNKTELGTAVLKDAVTYVNTSADAAGFNQGGPGRFRSNGSDRTGQIPSGQEAAPDVRQPETAEPQASAMPYSGEAKNY